MDSEWKYRKDSSLPYQNWCPFDPDDIVEIWAFDYEWGDYYESPKIGLAKDFWWGYSFLEPETVIRRARLLKSAETENEAKESEVMKKQIWLVCDDNESSFEICQNEQEAKEQLISKLEYGASYDCLRIFVAVEKFIDIGFKDEE